MKKLSFENIVRKDVMRRVVLCCSAQGSSPATAESTTAEEDSDAESGHEHACSSDVSNGYRYA